MLKLRPYQEEDVNFLIRLKSAGIFSEQRTGKTPIAVTLAKKRKLNKILIVCPASAIPVWENTWKQWYPESKIISGIGRTRTQKIENVLAWKQVLVVSYDSLKTTKTKKGLIEDIKNVLKPAKNPDMIILDEAHRIQTRNSATTSAVYQFIHTPYKLAITGTPASNKPYQIWSILRFLYPKTFTSYWRYVDEFYNVLEQTNHITNITFKTIGDFKSEKQRIEHAKMLEKMSVQRKRKDKGVMEWLPEKEYVRIKLEPSKKQKEAIEYLKKYFEVGEVETQGVLDTLTRERQLCAAPELLDIKADSPKINWIIQFLKDYPDKKILIFSKFTSFLRLLSQKIEKAIPNKQFKLFIGETPITTRAKIVENFQKTEDLNLLLLNIDAAKEAITLDEAEIAVFADKYPPVGSISQAEDRFVATTEDKKDKQHQIIELCIKDTYDEKIYDILKTNASMIDVLNDYKKYIKETKK